MTITHRWLADCDCTPSQDGLTNVVTAVRYRLSSIDDVTGAPPDNLEVSKTGTVELGPPDPAHFLKAPDEITSQVIRGWVADAAELEAANEAELAELAAAHEPVVTFSVGPADE